jgi:hypothetical protein
LFIPISARAGYGLAFCRVSVGEALDYLRDASARMDPGIVGWERLRKEPDVGEVSAGQVIYALRANDISLSDAWRQALGREEALRLGRISEPTEVELVAVVRRALGEGLELGPGWTTRWWAFSASRAWMPGLHRARLFARRNGTTLAEIVRQAGVPEPMDVLPTRGSISPSSVTKDELLSWIRAASREVAPGRISLTRMLGEHVGRPRSHFQRVLMRLSLATEEAWREALGDIEALRTGRIVPHTDGAWDVVLGWAFDQGLRPGRGWTITYRSMSKQHAWLPCMDALTVFARVYGGGPAFIADACCRWQSRPGC